MSTSPILPRLLRPALALPCWRRVGFIVVGVALGLLPTPPGAEAPPGIPALAASHAARSASPVRTLGFEERVGYQRRIEEVYWNHRIWPAENPGPKPRLDEVLPDALIRERVTAYLEKTAALEVFWSKPLSGEQLQSEVRRMVRETRSPGVLRELFAALDDDPYLIAECLARPVLVDRLARNWYARDERFHGELRQRAAAALANARGATDMANLGGEYAEAEWRLASDGSVDREPELAPSKRSVIELAREEWLEPVGRLAAALGVGRETNVVDEPNALVQEIPVDKLSPLTEDNDAFSVVALLSRRPDGLTVATVRWPKRSFQAWWAEAGRETIEAIHGLDPGPVPAPAGGYDPVVALDPGCAENTWRQLWYSPAPRLWHTAVWTGTEMIVWGGWDATVPLNTGGRYDPATDSWTETSRGPGVPWARRAHTAVWTGTEMIVWGGLPYTNSGGRYDPVTDGWTVTSTGAGTPTGRVGHTAVWTGTEMIVWGGSDEVGNQLNTGGRYDPATDSWIATSTAAGAPTGRVGHKSVWTGVEMIIWGGQHGSTNHDYTNTGGRYDPSHDRWSEISTGVGVPSARRDHSAVWTGAAMIVWGGQTSSSSVNTGGRYDPTADVWTPTSTASGLPERRYDHTAVWTGTEMIVWGGWGPTLTGGRYDPATDSWRATSTGAGVPTARSRHTAVWSGTEMIVWGGEVPLASGRDFLDNTGGRYDPATDRWTPTSIGGGVESGRTRHTAVWSGAEMIVWGGTRWTNLDVVNTGERYDPATDSWTPTSTGTGVPSPRYFHPAVWTGTEMIVWGGSGTNTGGRYDPTTDSWVATSTGAGVPTARSRPTAVWSGTEMIVWGGSSGTGSYYNTGGRYDPVTDRWTATSTGAGVAFPRMDHRAVWTGTEMIVWGGLIGGGSPSNTGGRYDPTNDTWVPTSVATGVPWARSRHTAVWTGTEMIVWGGAVLDGQYLGSGGRYDPATDNWTPTSTASGVPPRRWDHTAVWTGTEMIVWGGYDGLPQSTGGRYDPVTDTWTETPGGDDLPSERTAHSAVWTGTDMIVWGGAGGMSSGGLLCTCGAGAPSMWYPDLDQDGYGISSTGIPACEPPPNHSGVGGDCDDADPNCASDCVTDLDADGLRDCSDACIDRDGDGYGSAGGAGNECLAQDCDDSIPSCSSDCTDADGDGFWICAGDCDDGNAGIHPAGLEICNGADDDCNGLTDEDAAGEDSDGDAVHNLCDDCPTVPNPSQINSDVDPWGDACDNCPFVPNPTQSDIDSDLEGDRCDLNDGYVNLSFSLPTRLEWDLETGFDTWNSYSGDLDELRATGAYTQPPGTNPLADRVCGLAAAGVDDFTFPPQGKVAFYLVTGMHGEVESTLGSNGAGEERPNSAPCP